MSVGSAYGPRTVSSVRTRRGRPAPSRLLLRWFDLLCVPLILAAGISYYDAIRAPSNLSVIERSVEWLRGHHFGGTVSNAETWYYSHHQPATGGTLSSLPQQTSTATITTANPTGPAGITPLASNPLPGEGTWQPMGDPVGGTAAMEVAYMRPDSLHGSLLAGVVRIDQHLAKFALVPGQKEPGNGPWPAADQLNQTGMSMLLAGFNSGFRIADARGAFVLGGRQSGTLRDGAATAVISADGTLNIGAWASEVSASDHPVAIRQNLDLIVDGGILTTGLDTNVGNRWGRTVGNALYVWRSGVGIDAQGRILYVASSGLTVATLAQLLQRAGAVRAMELDINHSWVSFNTFHHASSSRLVGAKLLSGMSKSENRYLTTDSRDFFAVIARQSLTTS